MNIQTLADGLSEARERNWRGQFVKKLKHTEPDSREWLIWSKYHSCWHRRDNEGRAAGYTSDIAQAGVFVRAKASQYNDGDRNTAYHVSEVIPKLMAAREQHLKALAAVEFALRDYLENSNHD